MPALILTFLFIGIGWYLIIRPQQERAKAQRALIEAIEVGDRIISAGGIHGTVIEVDDDTIQLEVAPGTVLTLARMAVARRVDDGDGPVGGQPAASAAHGRDEDEGEGEAPGWSGAPVEDDVTNVIDGPSSGDRA